MSGPAHRSVASIRPSITGLSTATPGSPHTPTRAISSSYGSPSTLRAEEECVVIELGSRYLRFGFAGDPNPKATIAFNPSEQRRAGDFRQHEKAYHNHWRSRLRGTCWGDEHIAWNVDLRRTDLGLVGDKIEKAVKDAFTRYLLIDSRPRRITLAISTALPTPLLSTILDVLFNTFQAPTISLMSAPMLVTAAAGLRAGLVVDIGWAETTVTGIYEYREVICRRSVRAARLLSLEVLKTLAKAISPQTWVAPIEAVEPLEEEVLLRKVVSFEEVEDVMERLVWCRSSEKFDDAKSTDGLPAVQEEEEELDSKVESLRIASEDSGEVLIPLLSTIPPTTLRMPFQKLAEPCETVLLGECDDDAAWDDEELPLHLLIYRSLLDLPVDIRSICMSRIIFTGGVSNTPGLKSRIMDEVFNIIQHRGWNRVEGKAILQLSSNQKLRSSRSRQANEGPVEVFVTASDGAENQSYGVAAGDAQPPDPIELKLQREGRKITIPNVQGILRAVESMGAWSGASLLSQLRIPAVSVVEREQWLQHGVAGAAKPEDVLATNTRQSMGPAGLKPGGVDKSSWTLGAWG